MNVNDVELETIDPKEDRLKLIFERQKFLMEKYSPIEKKKGVGHGILPAVFSIDDARCQYVLKDYAWRVTEEIAEASESTDLVHSQEEVADAIHFYVEMMLLAGIGFDEFSEEFSNLPQVVNFSFDEDYDLLSRVVVFGVEIDQTDRTHRIPSYDVVEMLGVSMNCLKNKPWKSSEMATDVKKFNRKIVEGFVLLIGLAKAYDMDSNKIFEMYFKKSEVNKFRIRSNY